MLTPKQQELDPHWTRAPPADTCPFADFPTALHWVWHPLFMGRESPIFKIHLNSPYSWQQMLLQVHQLSATLLGLGFLVWNYSALGLKLLSPFFSIFHYLATVFFSSIFHNRVFQISFLLILHRIPESNNLDIKGGSHYTLACEEKHFWKGMF